MRSGEDPGFDQEIFITCISLWSRLFDGSELEPHIMPPRGIHPRFPEGFGFTESPPRLNGVALSSAIYGLLYIIGLDSKFTGISMA